VNNKKYCINYKAMRWWRIQGPAPETDGYRPTEKHFWF